MKKYILLFKLHISSLAAYRVEFFAQWIYRLLSLGVYITLWSLTARSEEEMHRLVLYFCLLYLIIENLATLKAAKWFSDAVHTGELNSYLIKPLNFPITIIIKVLMRIAIRVMIPIVLFIFAALIRPDIFAASSTEGFVFFVIFSVFGLILWNLFAMTIATISFYGTEIGHLVVVIDLIINFFKGAIIPAYLFPETLQNILFFTPLNYLGAFQIKMYQTIPDMNEVLQALIIMFIWIGFFFVLFKILYSKGLKQYEALGS